MNIIQEAGASGQAMTTGEAAERIAHLSEQWHDAEAHCSAFLGEYEQIDVLMMTEADFEAWRAEYARLYSALRVAQIAYYRAIRGGHD